MDASIRRWGNSLAVRVPRSFAETLGLEDGSVVDLTMTDGRLVISPKRPKYALDDLLVGVARENSQPDFDWGEPVGKEVW